MAWTWASQDSSYRGHPGKTAVSDVGIGFGNIRVLCAEGILGGHLKVTRCNPVSWSPQGGIELTAHLGMRLPWPGFLRLFKDGVPWWDNEPWCYIGFTFYQMYDLQIAPLFL